MNTVGTPYVEVTVVGSGRDGESVLVNPDQVASIWPARACADLPNAQAHATLHCVGGEHIAIAQTVAEFAELCADREEQYPLPVRPVI